MIFGPGIASAKIIQAEQRTTWQSATQRWERHTIDDSSQGADGVKLADANKDGRLDIVVGWEEGGVVRVYLNPGAGKAKERWPFVEVGQVGNVEDAVFVDVNDDGILDVVSSAEGGTRSVFFHEAPANLSEYSNPDKWKTAVLPVAANEMRWMFAIPVDVAGRAGMDIVAAGKDKGAQIGWFEASQSPDKLSRWKWHALDSVSWVMSILQYDLDKDGLEDIVYTDRKGEGRGVYWLKRTPEGSDEPFERSRYLAGRDHELMFMAIAAVETPHEYDESDPTFDLVVATKAHALLHISGSVEPSGLVNPNNIKTDTISFPYNTGTGKGVALADIDGDGAVEIVVTCEHASNKVGVFYIDIQEEDVQEEGVQKEKDNRAVAVDISGLDGTKFDRIEMLDIDGDGDLDILTCEEAEGLGVIWYENPLYN